uniref:NADH dehydrogenase subunit 4L n=1 Tax=Pheidole smythiesii TaxID=297326 RepID=UPI00257F847B|nr:NADH dehydrogenase subunit 4L [Pheidole smythiesii]WGV34068.1 NADH dehydrogenase subunit 4L [Pheidole smythiesii]
MFYDVVMYTMILFSSFLLVIFLYKYMLILLLFLELSVLNIALMMYLIYGMMSLDFYMIYYLVFSVCEGVLGLSLLVMIVRYYGSELYYMFNISKF